MKNKEKSGRYLAKTISDTDYADLPPCKNAPAQDDAHLHWLEQLAGSIDLYVNWNKIKFICFN